MGKRIVAENMSVSFKQETGVLPVLADLSLTVEPGEFLSIIGPSGSGKSTLLNAICAQIPYSGKLEVDGQSVGADAPSGIGYLYQKDHFLPWQSILENVAMPLYFKGISRAERNEIAGQALARVGLGKFMHFLPSKVSGGMLKRAALAQLVAYRPALLLMDEAFGSLDVQTSALLEDQFYNLWLEQRPTVIFVTHDPTEAVALGQRVVVFSARPARLIKEFKVDLPLERDVAGLRFSATARELEAEIWQILRGEVQLE